MKAESQKNCKPSRSYLTDFQIILWWILFWLLLIIVYEQRTNQLRHK